MRRARRVPSLHATADIGFVQFDMAGQQCVEAVGLLGQLPDLHAHAVGGLVGDAELALKLFAADAVARRAEEIHGIEPRNERRPRVVQDGVGSRRDLEPALRASV
jgi:hypothetical protein